MNTRYAPPAGGRTRRREVLRLLLLGSAISWVAVGCSDAPIPSEPAPAVQTVDATSSSTIGEYVAIDLGTLGGDRSDAIGINDLGQVAGNSNLASGDEHAFLWDGEAMRDLGTLGGQFSSAIAINEAGQIAGSSITESSQIDAFLWDGTMQDIGSLGPVGYVRDLGSNGQIAGDREWPGGSGFEPNLGAFLWDGTMHELGTLGGAFSAAYAVNGAGHVVGSSQTASGDIHPFLWDGDTMHDLGTLGGDCGYCTAVDINDAGQVVGNSRTASGDGHAFLWDGSTMRDLGTLGGDDSYSYPVAINEAGQVAGYSRTPSGAVHAFLWDGGTMRDLGTLGGESSTPRDLNELGQVVGTSDTGTSQHAFVWDGSAMRDLGTLGGTVSSANSINNAGLIVGSSRTSSNEYHATLWRLVTPSEQLAACADLVEATGADGVLNRGQARSLLAKLEAASGKLDAGKTRPAVGQLSAYQNEIRALRRSGRLGAGRADALASCVQDVIDALAR